MLAMAFTREGCCYNWKRKEKQRKEKEQEQIREDNRSRERVNKASVTKMNETVVPT